MGSLQMSQLSDLAFAHRDERVNLGRQVVSNVTRLWRSAIVADLDGSWDALGPQIIRMVTSGQVQAARQATPYLDAADRLHGHATPALRLAPESFGGVMLDGRELGPALYTGVTTTKSLIGRGVAPYTAFQAGANALRVVASAALQDMGRQADITLGRARTYTRYVRVVGGSACSRCAILAGQWSSETAFLRHTSCQCTTMPIEVEGKTPKGLHDSPEAYFQSLSKEDQDRVFTKAGAETIRQGGDPIKVVNARRGAYGIGYSGHYNIHVPVGTRNTLKAIQIGVKPDGSPLKVFATVEGTTARGAYGKSVLSAQRTSMVRLMPEQLVRMAGTDTARFRELITKYGYAY